LITITLSNNLHTGKNARNGGKQEETISREDLRSGRAKEATRIARSGELNKTESRRSGETRTKRES